MLNAFFLEQRHSDTYDIYSLYQNLDRAQSSRRQLQVFKHVICTLNYIPSKDILIVLIVYYSMIKKRSKKRHELFLTIELIEIIKLIKL